MEVSKGPIVEDSLVFRFVWVEVIATEGWDTAGLRRIEQRVLGTGEFSVAFVLHVDSHSLAKTATDGWGKWDVTGELIEDKNAFCLFILVLVGLGKLEKCDAVWFNSAE